MPSSPSRREPTPYGHPIEDVVFTVATNIAVNFAAYATITVNGRSRVENPCFCTIRDEYEAMWEFSGSAPKGLYRAVLLVPS
jgi:hypothetical protein